MLFGVAKLDIEEQGVRRKASRVENRGHVASMSQSKRSKML